MLPRSLVLLLGSGLDQCRRAIAVLWRTEARFRGIELGADVRFTGRPILEVQPHSTFRIGDGVHVSSSPRGTPLGNSQPCVLRTLSPGARLEIGPRVAISSTIICAAVAISIGEGTTCGAGAMIIDTDFHKPTGDWDWVNDYTGLARPITIGRGCFIGARAIVLKGVTIGDRAIVGAGAVVTRDVPSGARVGGNPARILSATSGATDVTH